MSAATDRATPLISSDERRKANRWDPQFTYYLTTRGLNKDGQIRALEFLPEWFHEHITVVSGSDQKEAVLSRYPKVNFWCTPGSVNSATKKRVWIFENAPSGKFFFMNDEIRILVNMGDGRATPAIDEPDMFRVQLRRLEALTRYYIGVSVHIRVFSQKWMNTTEMVHRNHLPGLIFFWNRDFVRKKIKLGRVQVGDFIDYYLQTLKAGYATADFAGLLFDSKATKMVRSNADRTAALQKSENEKLIKLHPDCVEWNPYAGDDDIMQVSVSSVRAYRPRKKIVILYDDKTRGPALMLVSLIQYRNKSAAVKYLAVGDTPEQPLMDRNAASQLHKQGLMTWGLDFNRLTNKRWINWADVVIKAGKSVVTEIDVEAAVLHGRSVNEVKLFLDNLEL